MFHKEGHKIILLTFITVVIITLLLDYFSINYKTYIQFFLIIQLIIVLQFFRNPKRITSIGDSIIINSSEPIRSRVRLSMLLPRSILELFQ